MRLQQITETWGQDDQSWLGSAHGTDNARPATLDRSTFTANTHYPNGYFVSGIPLGKITASGKFGPYNDAASDGTQTLVGFLFCAVEAGTTDIDPVGAILRHCFVVESKLPIAVDAAGKADVAGRVVFL